MNRIFNTSRLLIGPLIILVILALDRLVLTDISEVLRYPLFGFVALLAVYPLVRSSDQPAEKASSKLTFVKWSLLSLAIFIVAVFGSALIYWALPGFRQ